MVWSQSENEELYSCGGVGDAARGCGGVGVAVRGGLMLVLQLVKVLV